MISKYKIGDRVRVNARMPFRTENKQVDEYGTITHCGKYETFNVTLDDGDEVSCSIEKMEAIVYE